MPGVTREEIDRAKQINLLTYFRQYEPQELVRVGPHDFKTRTHDSLCISDNGMWHWQSRKRGGTTALNYLMLAYGLGFVEAVRFLNDKMGAATYVFQPVKPEPPRKQPVEFVLPTPDASDQKATEYLLGRGIDCAVLQYCHTQKLLYQISRGRYANCLFVGRDENENARSGTIRGCGGRFRGCVAGSAKDYGFCIPAALPGCCEVHVFEAPIDAMSGATLQKMQQNGNWQSAHYLAMGGLNYMTPDKFLEMHPEVTSITLCLDNDEAGRFFTQKLAERYRTRGYEVRDAPPRYGKDYNDTLLQCLGARNKNREAR